MDTRTIITALFEDSKAGRTREAMARYADDASYEIVAPPPIGGLFDLAGLRAFVARYLRPIFAGPFKIELVGMAVEGDRAAVEAVGTVLLVDGSTYRNRYHFLYVVRSGKISAVREYFDSGYLAATLARLAPDTMESDPKG